MILERKTSIEAPLAAVWEFFSEPGNLAVITPPWLGFKVVSVPRRAIQRGDRLHYSVRVLGFRTGWVSLISGWDPRRSFTDEQVHGPYRLWVHTHTFADAGGTVEMRDRVEYELPLGRLGKLFGRALVEGQLRAIFDYRERKIREIFG